MFSCTLSRVSHLVNVAGKVLMLTTPDNPYVVLPLLQSRGSALQGLLSGYYKLTGDRVSPIDICIFIQLRCLCNAACVVLHDTLACNHLYQAGNVFACVCLLAEMQQIFMQFSWSLKPYKMMACCCEKNCVNFGGWSFSKWPNGSHFWFPL